MGSLRNLTPEHLRCAVQVSCPAIYELEDVTPEHLRCDPVSPMCPAVLEITPEALRCPMGDCPGVFEVTPDELQCGIAQCPGVFETAATPTQLLIIGKKPTAELLKEIEGRVGPDEHAIVIDRALLANVRR